jgi:hypothetical protein
MATLMDTYAACLYGQDVVALGQLQRSLGHEGGEVG